MWARRLDVAVLEHSDFKPFVDGNGMILGFAYGTLVRPVSRPRWIGDLRNPLKFDWPNPWSEWRWFTLRLEWWQRLVAGLVGAGVGAGTGHPWLGLIWLVGLNATPFLSLRLWRPDGTYFGSYLGGKTVRVDSLTGHTWARPEDLGKTFFTLSASLRWRHSE